MGSPSLENRNLPSNTGAGAKKPAARRAPRRLVTALIVAVAVSTVCVLFLLGVVTITKFLEPVATPNALPSIKNANAKIVIHAPDGEGCRQRRFDNATGRMTDLNVSCEGPALDDSGRPIPKGTIGRLNQIGKSFQKR
jgi:hypothetical protein